MMEELHRIFDETDNNESRVVPLDHNIHTSTTTERSTREAPASARFEKVSTIQANTATQRHSSTISLAQSTSTAEHTTDSASASTLVHLNDVTDTNGSFHGHGTPPTPSPQGASGTPRPSGNLSSSQHVGSTARGNTLVSGTVTAASTATDRNSSASGAPGVSVGLTSANNQRGTGSTSDNAATVQSTDTSAASTVVTTQYLSETNPHFIASTSPQSSSINSAISLGTTPRENTNTYVSASSAQGRSTLSSLETETISASSPPPRHHVQTATIAHATEATNASTIDKDSLPTDTKRVTRSTTPLDRSRNPNGVTVAAYLSTTDEDSSSRTALASANHHSTMRLPTQHHSTSLPGPVPERSSTKMGDAGMLSPTEAFREWVAEVEIDRASHETTADSGLPLALIGAAIGTHTSDELCVKGSSVLNSNCTMFL